MVKEIVFKKLVREHQDRIYGYTAHMLGNRADAEDAVQNVFLRLWKHLDHVDGKKAGAWLMRVAHNHCIDQIRHRKSMNRVDSMDPQGLDRFPSRAAEMDPGRNHERSESHRMVRSAMEDVPERTRSMLLMHYLEGMKYEAIAETLGVSLSTVKVTIHRGKKRLREIIVARYGEALEIS